MHLAQSNVEGRKFGFQYGDLRAIMRTLVQLTQLWAF